MRTSRRVTTAHSPSRDVRALCRSRWASSGEADTTIGVLRVREQRRSFFRMTIRVLMADDHPVVRTGIRAMIANERDMTVVAEAAAGAGVAAVYEQHERGGGGV